MKLKLKRRMSGSRIKKAKRKVRLESDYHPSMGKIYLKNSPQKRHIENPNIYIGDTPIGCAFRNIRLPKKKRKTAWKRFRKNFPYVKVTKSGGKRFDEQKFKEFHDSLRSKSKNI